MGSARIFSAFLHHLQQRGGIEYEDEGEKVWALLAAGHEADDLAACMALDHLDQGSAAIVFARKQLASRGRRLLIYGPSRQVSRILTVTGLNHVGLVYASVEEALAEGFGPDSSGEAVAGV